LNGEPIRGGTGFDLLLLSNHWLHPFPSALSARPGPQILAMEDQQVEDYIDHCVRCKEERPGYRIPGTAWGDLRPTGPLLAVFREQGGAADDRAKAAFPARFSHLEK